MNLGRLRLLIAIVMAGFAVLNAAMMWRVRDSIAQGYGDFASFYTAGKILRQGQPSRLYDAKLQWEVQQQFASTVSIRKGPLPYIRPPFEALLFLPLAYLNYGTGFVVWSLIKVFLLVVFASLLPRDTIWPGKSPVVEGLLCLGFFPVGFDLLQGQDSILLVVVLTLVFFHLERRQEFRSGLLLGLGLFKFHLILPIFLVFVLKKKSRFVVGFLSVAVLLLALSLAIVGWQGLIEYPRYLFSLNQAPTLAGFKSYAMPNLRGLLTPFLGSGKIPLLAQITLLMVSAGGVISVVYFWRDSGTQSNRVGMAFCIVATILTSYYANSYDLTLLLLGLPLGATILARAGVPGWPRTLFIISAGTLLFTPLYWILALRVDQFNWCAVILGALAASLAASLMKLSSQPFFVRSDDTPALRTR